MSGSQLAVQILKHRGLHVQIARGSPNRYVPGERRAYLSPAIYDGTGAPAMAIAAHECAHAISHSQMGAAWLLLISRIEPINYFLERSTWNRAMLLLIEHLRPSLCDLTAMDAVRRDCLRVDGRRSLAYCGGAVAVFAVAWALRG